jgi:hypothetical protein
LTNGEDDAIKAFLSKHGGDADEDTDADELGLGADDDDAEEGDDEDTEETEGDEDEDEDEDLAIDLGDLITPDTPPAEDDDFDVLADIPAKQFKAFTPEAREFVTKARRQHKAIAAKLKADQPVANYGRALLDGAEEAGFTPEALDSVVSLLFQANQGDRDAIDELGGIVTKAGYEPAGEVDYSEVEEFIDSELDIDLSRAQAKKLKELIRTAKPKAAEARAKDPTRREREAARDGLDQAFREAREATTDKVLQIEDKYKATLDSTTFEAARKLARAEFMQLNTSPATAPTTVEDMRGLPAKFAAILSDKVKEVRRLTKGKNSGRRMRAGVDGLSARRGNRGGREPMSDIDRFLSKHS